MCVCFVQDRQCRHVVASSFGAFGSFDVKQKTNHVTKKRSTVSTMQTSPFKVAKLKHEPADPPNEAVVGLPGLPDMHDLAARLKLAYPNDMVVTNDVLARVDVADQYELPDWKDWPELEKLPSCDWHVWTYDQQVAWLLQFNTVAPDRVDDQNLNNSLTYGGYDSVFCSFCRTEIVQDYHQHCITCSATACKDCCSTSCAAHQSDQSNQSDQSGQSNQSNQSDQSDKSNQSDQSNQSNHVFERRYGAMLARCDVCQNWAYNYQYSKKVGKQQVDVCLKCQDTPDGQHLIQTHNMLPGATPHLSKHDLHDRFGSLLDWIPVCNAKPIPTKQCDCTDDSEQDTTGILLLNINKSSKLFGKCSIWTNQNNYISVSLLNHNLKDVLAGMIKQYEQYQLYLKLADQMKQPDHLVRYYAHV